MNEAKVNINTQQATKRQFNKTNKNLKANNLICKIKKTQMTASPVDLLS